MVAADENGPFDRRCRLWRPGDFDTPGTPARWFGRSAPLWVEIGFGNGTFLCDTAAEHPSVNFLGVETSPTCHRKALAEATERSLPNVQLVLAPAEFVVRDVVPRGALEGVIINFPSPWPKSAHEDRRLLDAEFWTVLADRVREQGSIQVTTDRSDYMGYALGHAKRTDLFKIEHVETPDRVRETKYARRAVKEHRAIETIRATRRDPPEPVQPVVCRIEGTPSNPNDTPETDSMHHAILSGELPRLETFDKQVRQSEDRTAILLDGFSQIGRETLLFAGQTNEPDLEQQILIEVIDRSDSPDKRGDLMVRMRPFNRPLATEGTRMAVDMVVDYLVEELGVASVIDRKY